MACRSRRRAPTRPRAATDLTAKGLPIVHVLIPSGFGDAPAAKPLGRNWAYGWENARDGLDGIALDIPALPGAADAVIPLNTSLMHASTVFCLTCIASA